MLSGHIIHHNVERRFSVVCLEPARFRPLNSKTSLKAHLQSVQFLVHLRDSRMRRLRLPPLQTVSNRIGTAFPVTG